MTPVQADRIAAAVRTAEGILSDTLGGPTKLAATDRLRDDRVFRCQVVEGPDHAPASVIIKQAWPGYDPAVSSRGADLFFNHWAGTHFAGSLPTDPPLGPQLFGGDHSHGLVIMEDLGEPQDLRRLRQRWIETDAGLDEEQREVVLASLGRKSLIEPLLEHDAIGAERWLVAFARTIGRLHASSMGRIAEYVRLRGSLSPPPFTDHLHHQLYRPDTAKPILDVLSMLGISPSGAFTTEIETVVRAMREPGPFLAYTHGDPCPDNCIQVGDQLRLIDFDHGGLRHALLDGVYSTIPFPTCWYANRIPAAVRGEMEAAYRTELIAGCPAAEDDALFHRAVADACTYWVLGWIVERHNLKYQLQQDRAWGIATLRQRTLARLELLVELSEVYGQLPEIRRVAAALLAILTRRWATTIAPLPLYPAWR